MKKKEFKQLLQGVRELGAALKGDKKVVTRTDRIERSSGTTKIRVARNQRLIA